MSTEMLQKANRTRALASENAAKVAMPRTDDLRRLLESRKKNVAVSYATRMTAAKVQIRAGHQGHQCAPTEVTNAREHSGTKADYVDLARSDQATRLISASPFSSTRSKNASTQTGLSSMLYADASAQTEDQTFVPSRPVGPALLEHEASKRDDEDAMDVDVDIWTPSPYLSDTIEGAAPREQNSTGGPPLVRSLSDAEALMVIEEDLRNSTSGPPLVRSLSDAEALTIIEEDLENSTGGPLSDAEALKIIEEDLANSTGGSPPVRSLSDAEALMIIEDDLENSTGGPPSAAEALKMIVEDRDSGKAAENREGLATGFFEADAAREENSTSGVPQAETATSGAEAPGAPYVENQVNYSKGKW